MLNVLALWRVKAQAATASRFKVPVRLARSRNTLNHPVNARTTDPTLLFTSAESPKAGPLLKCCVIFEKIGLSGKEMCQLGI